MPFPARDTKKEGILDKKFTVLRIIGTVYKVLAWIVLALGILALPWGFWPLGSGGKQGRSGHPEFFLDPTSL